MLGEAIKTMGKEANRFPPSSTEPLKVPERDPDDEFTSGEFSAEEEPEYNEKEAIKASDDFLKRHPEWKKVVDQAQKIGHS
jgi:hypothetical protein